MAAVEMVSMSAGASTGKAQGTVEVAMLDLEASSVVALLDVGLREEEDRLALVLRVMLPSWWVI